MPTDLNELEDAIARARAGDQEAYRRVIDATEAAVRIVVAAIVPERSQVDDVVQEVFITAWGKLADYQPGTEPLRWFKAFGRNLALNTRRQWLRQEDLRHSYRAELERRLEPALLQRSASAGPDLLDVLAVCMDALAGTGQALLREHYWEGISAEDIASRRGRDAGWVRVTLHRLRAAVADCLRTKGVSRV